MCLCAVASSWTIRVVYYSPNFVDKIVFYSSFYCGGGGMEVNWWNFCQQLLNSVVDVVYVEVEVDLCVS